MKIRRHKKRAGSGEFFVWATAAAVTVTFAILAVLIFVVMVNGLGYFWLSRIALVELKDGSRAMGEIVRHEDLPEGEGRRLQIKIGNRDLYGLDFRWINESDVAAITHPQDAVVLERLEYGNFYGFLKSGQPSTRFSGAAMTAGSEWQALHEALAAVEEKRIGEAETKDALSALGYRMEAARLELLGIKYKRGEDAPAEMAAVQQRLETLQKEFSQLNGRHAALKASMRANTATFADAAGKEQVISIPDIVNAWRANSLSWWSRAGIYLGKIWELLSGDPREANTEGGLFPAIFGTVMMVMIMSVFCIPLGVIAAIYLREYAKEGFLVRAVRVAVYNLAGVPSIVYGVFGLGFFVYGVGGSIDSLFFPERLPAPTFGTGGILWASLTLSLLTVPVVIVTTEEALASIPKGIREGSQALAATKFQTLMRVLLPMATPGIMTGFILAVARAAGEVAPLMITGVVKLAPALPLDGEFPFLHLNRKFMHLGFHIYDVGFQSPNVEAAKPMVYITTLLLVLIVLSFSLAAIFLRNSMRKRYQTGTF